MFDNSDFDEIFGDADFELDDIYDLEIPKPSLDELMEEDSRKNLLIQHLTGVLNMYLSGCGWDTEEDHLTVVRELEQYYPTFKDQSNVLLELLEQQLLANIFDPCGDFAEEIEDGKVEYIEKSANLHLARQKLLFAIRMKRIDLDEQNKKDME